MSHSVRCSLSCSLALVLSMTATAAAQDAPAGDDDAAPPAPADKATPPNADAPDDAGDEADVDALRQEYLRLRDELFRSRARAAAVGNALYSTRIVIHLDYESARHYSVSRATVRLDGANVYDDIQGAVAADKAPRFEGFVAPGRHQIGIRIEAVGKDDDRFTTIVEHTFTVQAPAGKDLSVKVRAKDDGDIPYRWSRKESGSYKLRVDAAVEATKRAEAAGASARSTPAPATRAIARRAAR